MAAIHYESAPNWHNDEPSRPKIIKTAEARSFLLRALDSSIVVRNNFDVTKIPEQVSSDLDDLVCYIESQPFDVMSKHAEEFLKKKAFIRAAGRYATGGESSEQLPFPVSGRLDNPVALQVVSSFAYERFHSVLSIKMQNLHEVDLSCGLAESGTERDRGVMRVMTAAIEDIDERGITLGSSDAARALGMPVRSRGSYYGLRDRGDY